MKEVKIVIGNLLEDATPNIHQESCRQGETYEQYFKRIGYFVIYDAINIDKILKLTLWK